MFRLQCPEEDYSTVVETLAIDDNWRENFGLKPKDHEYQPTERILKNDPNLLCTIAGFMARGQRSNCCILLGIFSAP